MTQFVPIDYCPNLLDPQFGSVTIAGSQNNNFNYQSGAIATYACNMGYILVGNMERMCMNGDMTGAGMWSGSEPTCERKLFQ